jgi:hypothetical protein
MGPNDELVVEHTVDIAVENANGSFSVVANLPKLMH